MTNKRKNRIPNRASQARNELAPTRSTAARETRDARSAIVHLDADRWTAFIRALDDPPQPTAQLRQLMARKPPWGE